MDQTTLHLFLFLSIVAHTIISIHMSILKVLLITIIVSLVISASSAHDEDNKKMTSESDDNDKDKKKTVTYDGRSLIINGRRELLFSGSIHYPRSTPEVPSSSRNIGSIIRYISREIIISSVVSVILNVTCSRILLILCYKLKIQL